MIHGGPQSFSAASDLIVVGRGLIGLMVAAALSRTGLQVMIVGEERPGAASRAAAGILSPSVERAEGAAHVFAISARDRYPSYLADLRDATGVCVWLERSGVIQAARTEAEARALREALPSGAEWLDSASLSAAEPALAVGYGGAFHPRDGAVDNVSLHRAVDARVRGTPAIIGIVAGVSAIDVSAAAPVVHTTAGALSAGHVVLAAGAWIEGIRGLPRRVPVRPVRGQMISYVGARTRHVVYGAGGYVVPRGGTFTLVGATMEEVGFDSSNTAKGVARLRRIAACVVPDLKGVPTGTAWAGLRPVTPDLLPIIGPDPDVPALVYACGHSRNGILLAPLTADVVAAVISGNPAPVDIRPFAISRFQALTP
ncbi:MAG: glycine oxidase ThiO [Gemmatimonadaceae bacterium]